MPEKTLILTESEIKGLVDMPEVLRIVEEAFRAHGCNKVQMPPKTYIHLEKYNGDFRAMPAYIEDMDACGVKWVNVHPANKKHGLPTVMALIILSDPKTGLPLAVMDGTYITYLRTGAAGGIAAKYLANKDSSKFGFVGCGVQASFQLMALNAVFDIANISVYDTDRRKADEFINIMGRLKIRIRRLDTIEECVNGKDVVVTTTPSRGPIVKSGWISPGTHINAIGADAAGKEELDPAVLKKGKVFVDDMVQACHSGEINVPISKKAFTKDDIAGTLGEVLCKKVKGRGKRSDITIFDSTGLAVQDIALAGHIYKIFRDLPHKHGKLKIDFKS